jgi:predicted component of type VI protein secretion system
MKAELIPEGGGAPIPVTRDVTVVGRREYCDIQFNDPSLSKRHCILVKTDGLLVVRDLASTNGTKVKGQKIRWAALLPDDRITLGALKFRVYLGPDSAPSPSERPGGSRVAPVAQPAWPARGPSESPTPGFAAPSPMSGMPILPQSPSSRRAPEPVSALVLNDDDLVLVEEDDEIIELE